MRSPTCIVSTRRRWRLFRPWIVNPCSRVWRKLSGELTIIQNWEARPSVRPDLRLRRWRPDLAGLSGVAAPASGVGALPSVVSDTSVIVFLLYGRRHRAESMGLGQQDGQVSDLRDVGDLVACDQPAHLQQGDVARARISELALPLVLAPAVQEVDSPAANSGEVLEGLLQGALELLVVAWVDGGANVGGGHAVQVGVAQQGVHLRSGVEQMADQTAEGGECRAVAISQTRL